MFSYIYTYTQYIESWHGVYGGIEMHSEYSVLLISSQIASNH